MTARTRNLGLVVIVCLVLAILYLENGRQETNQQGQPAVEKLYEVRYFPNRTVIRVESVTSDRTRKALTEIEKKYDIQEIIDRSPMGFNFTRITIIAVPKDPNFLLP